MSFHEETEIVRVRHWLCRLAGTVQEVVNTVGGMDFPAPSTIRAALGTEPVEGLPAPAGDAVVGWVAEIDETARRITKHFEELGVECLPF